MSSRPRKKRVPAEPGVPTIRRPQEGPMLMAIGSGKGGVGKSFFTGGLAWSLAEAGHRVLAVDADFGGPNLHTCLGVKGSPHSLSSLAKGMALEDALVPTALDSLKMIPATGEPLHSANARAANWHVAIERLLQADADVVLLDLGAGSSYLMVDLFLMADAGILVTTPEPTAVENAYRFLKTAFFRFIASRAPNERIRQVVAECLRANGTGRPIHSPTGLLQELGKKNAGLVRGYRRALDALKIYLLVNQTRFPEDEDLDEAMALASRKVFALPTRPLGTIPYDEEVIRALRSRQPFLAEGQGDVREALRRASATIAQLLREGHPSDELGTTRQPAPGRTP